MYLSKLLLDPKSRQVQCEISNRYELHRTLTAQFPEKNRKDIDLLYRLELANYQSAANITLLVQTQLFANWDNLVNTGMLTTIPEVKLFEVDFFEGDSFYFRLLGNPTIRRKQPDGKSKRVGLYAPEAQQDWLKRKADQGGFKILGVQLRDFGLIESRKRKNNETFVIKHQAVQFDGLLKITDTDKFNKTIKNGIGSAKAFGFGLLSLAK